MLILLDTHVLLWALAAPEKLSKTVREHLEDPDADIRFSAASIWEIAIKSELGLVTFPVRPDEIVAAAIDSGFRELPVRAAAAALVASLPRHHHDPIDRLLLAQAVSEPARFCTVDKSLAPYSDLVRFL